MLLNQINFNRFNHHHHDQVPESKCPAKLFVHLEQAGHLALRPGRQCEERHQQVRQVKSKEVKEKSREAMSGLVPKPVAAAEGEEVTAFEMQVQRINDNTNTITMAIPMPIP